MLEESTGKIPCFLQQLLEVDIGINASRWEVEHFLLLATTCNVVCLFLNWIHQIWIAKSNQKQHVRHRKQIKDKLCSNHQRVAHDVFLGSIDKTTWAEHPKLFLYSVRAPVNVGITINLDQPCTCPKAAWPLHKLSINILWETKITLPEIIPKIQNSSNR
jgi:hypothetical protein